MNAIRLPLILLVVLLPIVAIRADDKSGEFAELAQAVQSSIQNDDIVEYTSCWLSLRAGRAAAPEGSTEFTAENIDRTKAYFRNRNKNIAKSFETIQTAIREHRVDRETIRLVSVDAAIREANGIKRTDDFTFTFNSNVGEIKLEIDDGASVNGLWYFIDSPTSLQVAGQKKVRFPRVDRR